MAYQLTASEIAQIQAARLLSPVGDALPTSTGNWVPFYQTLSDMVNGVRHDYCALCDDNTPPFDYAWR